MYQLWQSASSQEIWLRLAVCVAAELLQAAGAVWWVGGYALRSSAKTCGVICGASPSKQPPEDNSLVR
jgi:hypothetical protein